MLSDTREQIVQTRIMQTRWKLSYRVYNMLRKLSFMTARSALLLASSNVPRAILLVGLWFFRGIDDAKVLSI
jgi:hypothetical protein